jgi:thiamine pyrophosphokinase
LSNSEPRRRAIIVADGDVPTAEEIAPLLAGHADGPLVIAADGGLRKAELLGLAPSLVVGDGDSLAPELLERLPERGVEVQLHPVAKDASDTELAVREALARGATDIVVLGAFGGQRFEHALANVLLLTMPELDGREARLVDGRSVVRAISGGQRLRLSHAEGRLVSLLPLSQRAEGVRTQGLRFALEGEALEQGSSRGLSNELIEDEGEVVLGFGRLAVVQTRMGGIS